MSKVIRTYSELMVLSQVLEQYTINYPESKLTATIKKFATKSLVPLIEEYSDELDTLKIKNCLVDPITKAILKDEKGERQFGIEGTIKLKEEIKKLLKQEVEVTPFILEEITDIILSEKEKELFTGIVIP